MAILPALGKGHNQKSFGPRRITSKPRFRGLLRLSDRLIRISMYHTPAKKRAMNNPITIKKPTPTSSCLSFSQACWPRSDSTLPFYRWIPTDEADNLQPQFPTVLIPLTSRMQRLTPEIQPNKLKKFGNSGSPYAVEVSCLVVRRAWKPAC